MPGGVLVYISHTDLCRPPKGMVFASFWLCLQRIEGGRAYHLSRAAPYQFHTRRSTTGFTGSLVPQITLCDLICRFKIGARYTGNYVEGKKNGEGVFLYPDGSKYDGSWINDLRNGWGTYTYPNGDTYEGEWYQGVRHGQGTYTYNETGSHYEGTWFHGKMQDEGHLVHSNHRYIGNFEENRPRGPGKYVFDSACVQLGKYVWKEEENQGEHEEDEAEILVTPMWEGKQICAIEEEETA